MPKTPSDGIRHQTRARLHGPAMGTRWSVLCDVAPEFDLGTLQQELAAAVRQVDEQMSPWKPASDLMRLNRAPPGEWISLPAEIMTVLARAIEVARQSKGAFDAAVGDLVDAWGFGAPRNQPDTAAIGSARAAARKPSHQTLELDPAAARARRHAPMQLDLCGIAKGYAVDRMVAVLRQHAVEHALAALDGELRAIGSQAGGAPWAVALESPLDERRAAHGVIELQDLAVATSGDYRHFMRVGDARIAHTMDPRRTAPANNTVASVTVLAADCMSADAWATALLVAGPGEGMVLARRHGLEALWLLRQGASLVELGLGRFGNEMLPAPAPAA